MWDETTCGLCTTCIKSAHVRLTVCPGIGCFLNAILRQLHSRDGTLDVCIHRNSGPSKWQMDDTASERCSCCLSSREGCAAHSKINDTWAGCHISFHLCERGETWEHISRLVRALSDSLCDLSCQGVGERRLHELAHTHMLCLHACMSMLAPVASVRSMLDTDLLAAWNMPSL